MRNVLLLSLVLFLPSLSEAQSLGSVAKKERERREKNKAEGVAVREITEEEISTDTGEPDVEGETEESAGGEAAGAEDGEGQPLLPAVDKGGERTDALDKEQQERRRSEAEWRAKIQQARDRIVAARQQVQVLEGLFLVDGERYVDEQGRTVIESLDHLRRLVQEAKEELRDAEHAFESLQQEARRAGVPPGWLR